MAFQPPAPLRRNVERIDQPREQREIADLDREILKPRRAHAFDREIEHFDVGRFAILHAQTFDARLQELARPFRLARLKAKRRAVIGEPRRKFAAPRKMHAAHRNGELGPQAQLLPRRIGQHESAAADFLARAVEENNSAGCRIGGSTRA